MVTATGLQLFAGKIDAALLVASAARDEMLAAVVADDFQRIRTAAERIANQTREACSYAMVAADLAREMQNSVRRVA